MRNLDQGKNLKDLGKIKSFSSSSNLPFKVEAKLEIPMYDGQVNVEVLNRWLKQMEVYFVLYQVQEVQHIYFSILKMTGHVLLWYCIYHCLGKLKYAREFLCVHVGG